MICRLEKKKKRLPKIDRFMKLSNIAFLMYLAEIVDLDQASFHNQVPSFFKKYRGVIHIDLEDLEASKPLFIIPGFFLHFSLEPSYGYLRFEGNGKIPLGR